MLSVSLRIWEERSEVVSFFGKLEKLWTNRFVRREDIVVGVIIVFVFRKDLVRNFIENVLIFLFKFFLKDVFK